MGQFSFLKEPLIHGKILSYPNTLDLPEDQNHLAKTASERAFMPVRVGSGRIALAIPKMIFKANGKH